MKRCSTLLIIRKVRYHLTPVRMAVIKKNTNNKCWWECKWVQPLWKTGWRFLKKLKIELPYDPAIPFLGLDSKKMKTVIRKGTCSLVFIAALFTIAKTWKQPKCPLTEEWIKKMWYIYTMEYYSAVKIEWNNAICSNTDGPRSYHTKWSKSDGERQISYDITHMWNLILKMIQTNLFTKQKQTYRYQKQTYGFYPYKREMWGGGDKSGAWD